MNPETEDPAPFATDLLPCPFCGSFVTADEETVEDGFPPDFESTSIWWIHCPVCCAMEACSVFVFGYTREQAARRWNRRRPDPELGALSGVVAQAFRGGARSVRFSIRNPAQDDPAYKAPAACRATVYTRRSPVIQDERAHTPALALSLALREPGEVF